MPQPIYLKRRPWPCRFVRSYMGWRAIYGRWASLKAAWLVSRM